MSKLLVILFLIPEICHAYIGPGMAGGLVVSIVGIIIALILGFVAIIFFPIKRLLKRLKTKKK